MEMYHYIPLQGRMCCSNAVYSADSLWGQLLQGLLWLKSCHVQSSALTGAARIWWLSERGGPSRLSHTGLIQDTWQVAVTPKLPTKLQSEALSGLQHSLISSSANPAATPFFAWVLIPSEQPDPETLKP